MAAQTLHIEGFLGIENAEISFDGLTILIGPQASGKSIVARLMFFCAEYFSDFDAIALLKNQHKTTYDSEKREVFAKIFPTYSWLDDEFSIKFTHDHHSLCLKSKKGSGTVELSTSKSVASSFRSLKKSFQEFSKVYSDEKVFSPTRIMREFRAQNPDIASDLRGHGVLFVPASRSFYSTIREEIFSILSIDEKIDQIIMQFGEFYEGAKFRLAYEADREATSRHTPKYHDHFERFFYPIIKGRYTKIDGRDWLETARGRIEISRASSGQQEALPLLCALSQFPRSGRSLIIEEPEAHLFPSAQVKILEFVVEQAVKSSTNIFITTHSPYLVSALNNFLLRGANKIANGIDPGKVNAYYLQDGRANDIFDREYNMISADYIDAVSDDIAQEFASIIGETDD